MNGPPANNNDFQPFNAMRDGYTTPKHSTIAAPTAHTAAHITGPTSAYTLSPGTYPPAVFAPPVRFDTTDTGVFHPHTSSDTSVLPGRGQFTASSINHASVYTGQPLPIPLAPPASSVNVHTISAAKQPAASAAYVVTHDHAYTHAPHNSCVPTRQTDHTGGAGVANPEITCLANSRDSTPAHNHWQPYGVAHLPSASQAALNLPTVADQLIRPRALSPTVHPAVCVQSAHTQLGASSAVESQANRGQHQSQDTRSTAWQTASCGQPVAAAVCESHTAHQSSASPTTTTSATYRLYPQTFRRQYPKLPPAAATAVDINCAVSSMSQMSMQPAGIHPRQPVSTQPLSGLQPGQHVHPLPGPLPPPSTPVVHVSPQSSQQNSCMGANSTYVPSGAYGQLAATHLPAQAAVQRPPQQGPLTHGDSSTAARRHGSVLYEGFNTMWGTHSIDLFAKENIYPEYGLSVPRISLSYDQLSKLNCSPDIFRCTLNRVPETSSILQKSRLPFGIILHPFKDLNSLPVVQCNTIVRCRYCRAYINPFVFLIDCTRWRCNICFRSNELTEEFQYDPVSKTYGDPSRRPECRYSTLEFVALTDYIARPPQQTVCLFVLDITQAALKCGYIHAFCSIVLSELDNLPGDARTQVGFIAFDQCVYFYDLLNENCSKPQILIVNDVEDMFLPSAEGLLVNLKENRESVERFLRNFPNWLNSSYCTHSACGPALQAAYKLLHPIGGRVTLFLASMPSLGPGKLTCREDPSNRAGKEVFNLQPANDFYKRLALDCSSQHIAVDVFSVAASYIDISTLSTVCQYSSGSVYYFADYHALDNVEQMKAFDVALRRYLTRKAGYEALLRIRCTSGLAMHTFYGNCFVRSTNLLALPNVSPDAAFGIQVSIEESLKDINNVCFQAALLYTNSKAERRIRVHTVCLPVTPNLNDVIQSADQEAVVCLLSKMAAERCVTTTLGSAREALVNSVVDAFDAYKSTLSAPSMSGLDSPQSCSLLPLFIHALLKHPAIRLGVSTRLDERSYALTQFRTLPISYLMRYIYPAMYALHTLDDQHIFVSSDDTKDDEEEDGSAGTDEEVDASALLFRVPQLQLSARHVHADGVYLMDCHNLMLVIVCKSVSATFVRNVFGYEHYHQLPAQLTLPLPELNNADSERLRAFLVYLDSTRPYYAPTYFFREDSALGHQFYSRLVEDRTESSYSYVEFLQFIKSKL